MDWLRHNSDLVLRRRNLLFPKPEPDRGSSIAELPDAETVCDCTGVSNGAIIQAIHQRGIDTLPRPKEATRASTGVSRVRFRRAKTARPLDTPSDLPCRTEIRAKGLCEEPVLLERIN
jgi:hypothetical protein